MPTSDPRAFTERGDRAEAAAYHGDGVYSGGDFAGGDAERYDRLSVADPDADAGPREHGPGKDGAGKDGAGKDGGDEGAGTLDVESRDLQHTPAEQNATTDTRHSDRA